MNKLTFALPVIIALSALAVEARELVSLPVAYHLDGSDFEGRILYHPDSIAEAERRGATLPALFMVPNWMGPSAQAFEKARRIADSQGAVVFVADVYGTDTRPSNAREASAAAGALRSGNRQLLRERALGALDIFQKEIQARDLPANPKLIIAIGFCFGGGTVLEMARAGVDLPGVVSFHGNLDTPRPAQPGEITASVLVLHGAVDPYVPPQHVQAFENEMNAAAADWQLIAYGGAVHSFTNPEANSDGARYHPIVAERSFNALRLFIAEKMP